MEVLFELGDEFESCKHCDDKPVRNGDPNMLLVLQTIQGQLEISPLQMMFE